MRMFTAAGLLGAMLLASHARAADGDRAPSRDGPRDWLRDLSAETEEVRVHAKLRLARTSDLTDDAMRKALLAADWRSRPVLIELAGMRRMTGLVPDIVGWLASAEPLVADAAARALVVLGDEAVAAGLGATVPEPGCEPSSARIHLAALAARAQVERGLLSRWRRKGGMYSGRYKSLAPLGWPLQPVLLAMLLDVPLSDHDIVLPETKDPVAASQLQHKAIDAIFRSNRRGYRTFDPLPPQIEPEELFGLAAQALKDLGDLDLMGDILENVSARLAHVDEVSGFRLRPVEKYYFHAIDEVLFARGRPERLLRVAAKAQEEADRARMWVERSGGENRTDALRQLASELSDYAGVLHQIGRYDEAARLFLEAIRIGKMQGGKEPALEGYNRACALAKAGRKAQAIQQLDRALDRGLSSGFEDLTREWVTEDGDLDTLRDDPAYKAMLVRRFGE